MLSMRGEKLRKRCFLSESKPGYHLTYSLLHKTAAHFPALELKKFKVQIGFKVQIRQSKMADLGTPAAGSATPNPAAAGAGSSGKQPMTYICGGELGKHFFLVDMLLCVCVCVCVCVFRMSQ